MRSHTMLEGKAWLSVSTLIHPKSVLSGWGQSSSSTLKLSHPCLYGPCFVHWFTVMLKQERTSPDCSHKVGSMALSNISWYAEAFRVPFTGTKGPSPAPEKQPHTIIPPPPNFTLGTMQSDKYRSPGNRQTQTRPSDCQMEKRDSTGPESSSINQCFALHMKGHIWRPHEV